MSSATSFEDCASWERKDFWERSAVALSKRRALPLHDLNEQHEGNRNTRICEATLRENNQGVDKALRIPSTPPRNLIDNSPRGTEIFIEEEREEGKSSEKLISLCDETMIRTRDPSEQHGVSIHSEQAYIHAGENGDIPGDSESGQESLYSGPDETFEPRPWFNDTFTNHNGTSKAAMCHQPDNTLSSPRSDLAQRDETLETRATSPADFDGSPHTLPVRPKKTSKMPSQSFYVPPHMRTNGKGAENKPPETPGSEAVEDLRVPAEVRRVRTSDSHQTSKEVQPVTDGWKAFTPNTSQDRPTNRWENDAVSDVSASEVKTDRQDANKTMAKGRGRRRGRQAVKQLDQSPLEQSQSHERQQHFAQTRSCEEKDDNEQPSIKMPPGRHIVEETHDEVVDQQQLVKDHSGGWSSNEAVQSADRQDLQGRVDDWGAAPIDWEARDPWRDDKLAVHIRAWRTDIEPCDYPRLNIKQDGFRNGVKPLGDLGRLATPPNSEPERPNPENNPKRGQTSDTAMINLKIEMMSRDSRRSSRRNKEPRQDSMSRLELPDVYTLPHAPTIRVRLRPARMTDLNSCKGIYLWYAWNSASVLERDLSPENAHALLRAKFIEVDEADLPWLVAFDRTRLPGQNQKFEKIVGFAFAEEFGARTGALSETVKLSVFTHSDYLQKGIARTLMDRLTCLIDATYAPRGGYMCTGDRESRFFPGGPRRVSSAIFHVPYYSDEDHIERWMKRWLGDFGYEEVGLLPRVGKKRRQ